MTLTERVQSPCEYDQHPEETAVGAWLAGFDPGRSASEQDREEASERLVKTIGKQQIQIDWLKRARNLGCVDRKSMISKSMELSIGNQCELLDLSHSGHYYKPRPETPYNQTLMRRIDELHTAEPTWGSRLLRDRLRLEGHQVNRKRIQRLMALMGIQTIYSKRNHEHRVYPYLLRGLTIDRPTQVWSAGITYIRLRRGWVYMIIDWYFRAILSWRLSNTCGRFFCMNALPRVLQNYGTPEIFNTDQGSQFTSGDFTKVFEGRQTRISMGGKGRWRYNIFIERLWRKVKYEEVYLYA